MTPKKKSDFLKTQYTQFHGRFIPRRINPIITLIEHHNQNYQSHEIIIKNGIPLSNNKPIKNPSIFKRHKAFFLYFISSVGALAIPISINLFQEHYNDIVATHTAEHYLPFNEKLTIDYALEVNKSYTLIISGLFEIKDKKENIGLIADLIYIQGTGDNDSAVLRKHGTLEPNIKLGIASRLENLGKGFVLFRFVAESNTLSFTLTKKDNPRYTILKSKSHDIPLFFYLYEGSPKASRLRTQ